MGGQRVCRHGAVNSSMEQGQQAVAGGWAMCHGGQYTAPHRARRTDPPENGRLVWNTQKRIALLLLPLAPSVPGVCC